MFCNSVFVVSDTGHDGVYLHGLCSGCSVRAVLRATSEHPGQHGTHASAGDDSIQILQVRLPALSVAMHNQ